jgi:hypothetical protein
MIDFSKHSLKYLKSLEKTHLDAVKASEEVLAGRAHHDSTKCAYCISLRKRLKKQEYLLATEGQ